MRSPFSLFPTRGFWNPKQSQKSGQDGLFGVFAVEPIQEDEVLASVPWNCVIPTPNGERFDDCGMVQTLANELEKGKASSYALYVQGLHKTAQEHSALLPTYWSPKAQELLAEIVLDGGALPPHDVLHRQNDWKNKCEKISKEATLLVMTHGEDIGMVPVTDKYNSRSGRWEGAVFSKEGDDAYYSSQQRDPHGAALEIRAKRNIRAGEQIFTNYKDYSQVGTPELLRDYGFVETYPQTWIFHDQQIAFDIIEPRKGSPEVSWIPNNIGVAYRKPDETTIQFLRDQLLRLLKQVYPILKQSRSSVAKAESASGKQEIPQSLSEHEYQTILQFYDHLTMAIRLAIQDAHDRFGVGTGIHHSDTLSGANVISKPVTVTLISMNGSYGVFFVILILVGAAIERCWQRMRKRRATNKDSAMELPTSTAGAPQRHISVRDSSLIKRSSSRPRRN